MMEKMIFFWKIGNFRNFSVFFPTKKSTILTPFSDFNKNTLSKSVTACGKIEKIRQEAVLTNAAWSSASNVEKCEVLKLFQDFSLKSYVGKRKKFVDKFVDK